MGKEISHILDKIAKSIQNNVSNLIKESYDPPILTKSYIMKFDGYNELNLGFDANNALTVFGTPPVNSGWNTTTNYIYYKGIIGTNNFVGIGNTDPKGHLFVGANGLIFRLADTTSTLPNYNYYYTQIATNDTENSNTKIRLIKSTRPSDITDNFPGIIPGSIYYTTSGTTAAKHIFNYDGNSNVPLMTIDGNGLVTIGGSNYARGSNNEKLIISGSVAILNSNNQPSIFTIGSSNFNGTNVFNLFDGRLNISSSTISNQSASNYSLYVEKNALFNSNVEIGCNLIISGTLTGGNINASSITYDINNRINANAIRINSNAGLNVSPSGDLLVNINSNSGLFFNSNSNYKLELKLNSNGLFINNSNELEIKIDPNKLGFINNALTVISTTSISAVVDSLNTSGKISITNNIFTRLCDIISIAGYNNIPIIILFIIIINCPTVIPYIVSSII